jgi:chemotaxis protein methyltransferase CheR
MIFVRYVLIYFTIECKKEIVSRFREVLTPPAFLVLGATETLRGVAENYNPRQHAGGTYYIKE